MALRNWGAHLLDRARVMVGGHGLKILDHDREESRRATRPPRHARRPSLAGFGARRSRASAVAFVLPTTNLGRWSPISASHDCAADLFDIPRGIDHVDEAMAVWAERSKVTDRIHFSRPRGFGQRHQVVYVDESFGLRIAVEVGEVEVADKAPRAVVVDAASASLRVAFRPISFCRTSGAF